MKYTYLHLVFLSFIMASFFSMNAQQENNGELDMITDRPDATESPSVVPKGSLQIETGTYHESHEENGFRTDLNVLNTTLIRYGLWNNLELRLGWDFVEEIKAINDIRSNDRLSGLSPLLLGMKVSITAEKNCWPEIGFIGHLKLPFLAGTDFKPQNTAANFLFAFSHTLNDKFNLSYNLGAELGDDSSETVYIYSTSYGYSITDRFGTYVEVYGNISENSISEQYYDTGVTFLLKRNIQLDATIGKSFKKGKNALISAGISFRIPD